MIRENHGHGLRFEIVLSRMFLRSPAERRDLHEISFVSSFSLSLSLSLSGGKETFSRRKDSTNPFISF